MAGKRPQHHLDRETFLDKGELSQLKLWQGNSDQSSLKLIQGKAVKTNKVGEKMLTVGGKMLITSP